MPSVFYPQVFYGVWWFLSSGSQKQTLSWNFVFSRASILRAPRGAPPAIETHSSHTPGASWRAHFRCLSLLPLVAANTFYCCIFQFHTVCGELFSYRCFHHVFLLLKLQHLPWNSRSSTSRETCPGVSHSQSKQWVSRLANKSSFWGPCSLSLFCFL